jgi:hypothetical protein
MAAYMSFAQDLEEGEVDVRVVYWLMFHKPSPDSEGGCSFDDVSWKRRDPEYDECSFHEATNAATASLDAVRERDRTDAELLNAVGTIHEYFDNGTDSDTCDVNDGVDLFADDGMDEVYV